MNKVQQILAEIERLTKVVNFEHEAGYNDALDDIKRFINSLPEEPVSEDLDKAAKYHRAHGNYGGDINLAMEDSFRLGARWKEQQTRKEVEGIIDALNKSCDPNAFGNTPQYIAAAQIEALKLVINN